MVYAIGAGSVVVVILGIIGLVDLYRVRDTLETWKMVTWALFIILIPIVGLFSWLLWRLARSQVMIDALEMGASTREPPDDHRIRAKPPGSP
ncbi:MAG: hypothetical protein ABFS21_07495 [Actinomycetota bacterium]